MRSPRPRAHFARSAMMCCVPWRPQYKYNVDSFDMCIYLRLKCLRPSFSYLYIVLYSDEQVRMRTTNNMIPDDAIGLGFSGQRICIFPSLFSDSCHA